MAKLVVETTGDFMIADGDPIQFAHAHRASIVEATAFIFGRIEAKVLRLLGELPEGSKATDDDLAVLTLDKVPTAVAALLKAKPKAE